MFQVFQIAYILIKAAISPRPANWILERSVDGKVWAPWQFFAISDEECWHAYGVEPKIGKPNSYDYDEEVICTSYYSKLEPLENGEVRQNYGLIYLCIFNLIIAIFKNFQY